jgi:large subunit ribosomal protein L10
MTRAEKGEQIAELKEKFSNSSFFYLTDSSTLTVEQINELRGKLYEQNIEMRVVKNTLAQKALEAADAEKGYAGLFEALKGPTAVLFTEVANSPARVIEEFRKTAERPLLKAAYIDSSIYLGDDQLKALAALKSKEELVGEIISLLQSPAKNVISALKSSGSSISGLLKTLEERGEK